MSVEAFILGRWSLRYLKVIKQQKPGVLGYLMASTVLSVRRELQYDNRVRWSNAGSVINLLYKLVCMDRAA